MDRHAGLESIHAPVTARAVTALGVFDGVHRGHRAVLDRVCDLAARIDGSPWMITFANHPDTLLRQREPAQITSLEQRLELLEDAGIEHCWILDFDEHLRDMSAEDFVRELLVGRLGVAGVVLGEGARFGHRGLGSLATLETMGSAHGFETFSVAKLVHDEAPISSTRIRAAVAGGDLDGARAMLGRPYTLRRPIVAGDGRGSSIGVPTANLAGPFPLLPPLGVYLSHIRAASAAGSGWSGFAVTNIGCRPTFDGGAPGIEYITVEAHLLDFDGDLTGAELDLALLECARDERKFAGADELVAQIRQDVDWARARLREWKPRLGIDLTPQTGEL